MSHQSWTIGRLLTWTTDYFGKQGIEGPRLDAEVLLAEARGCQRIELYAAYDEPADEVTRATFRELVQRRSSGTPVAYLVGRREFYSMSFEVNPDVLIPRPETEFVVIALLDELKSFSGTAEIADVGTGSGIIAIATAKHWPDCRVTAIDVDPAALAVARCNAAKHEVDDRITFLESDLYDAIPPDQTFAFVVSNPPYVSAAEYARLDPEVKDQEPKRALLGGETGTEIIQRLLDQTALRLHPGGKAIIEISPMIQDTVEKLIENDPRYELGSTIKDLARLPRVVQARRCGNVEPNRLSDAAD